MSRKTGPVRAALSGMAASAALVLLVVGVPAVLALAVGWPLPHGLPTGAEISQAA